MLQDVRQLQRPGWDLETFRKFMSCTIVRHMPQYLDSAPNDLYQQLVPFSLRVNRMDVVTAFLNWELDHDVCIEISKIVSVVGGKSSTFELVKSLHGLKQAPIVCVTKIYSFLNHVEFIISPGDPCFSVR